MKASAICTCDRFNVDGVVDGHRLALMNLGMGICTPVHASGLGWPRKRRQAVSLQFV